jgi:hypothetical protein
MDNDPVYTAAGSGLTVADQTIIFDQVRRWLIRGRACACVRLEFAACRKRSAERALAGKNASPVRRLR